MNVALAAWEHISNESTDKLDEMKKETKRDDRSTPIKYQLILSRTEQTEAVKATPCVYYLSVCMSL